ncbi:hypothetical protein CCH79_00010410 [Gambusia affinis]|uniref:Myotubularin phosphatase domain-containing protein n=1 Tax=Gambusia affinis TaxID=33528 RepID=A0A315V0L4_GAMAF|nr:hypothetical protein CCH79_00010410 [Gambusia affinis]
MFSGKPMKPTFKCYLPPAQNDVKNNIEPPVKLEPKFLPGEIIVNEVNFVRKCIVGTDSSQSDLWGRLICTNFKVSFIPQEPPPKQKSQLSHLLLGQQDISLTCLDQVVTVNDTRGKKKVLGSNQKLKFNPMELILYCKDLRVIRFCFDEAGPESAKKVCLAIAHYSHPADLHLLFGFEYQGLRYHQSKDVLLWFSLNSFSLPEYIVVPVSLTDQELKQLSSSFNDGRVPLWCWNHRNGSSLVRMAGQTEPLAQRKTELKIFTAITKSHPQRREVTFTDLDRNLPNIQEIQSAFIKARQICTLDPFEESEERWLSSIENSRWLEYIRMFLKVSAETVYNLDGKNASVVLLEEEDRDLNCVVSSLVQLMLDPRYRSLNGFQSLVQKEWVMAGHRFLDRCNHLKKNDNKESPLFTLFLDCVWQLTNQYPAAFEFTEAYLTVLSDSMWIPLFSTFLFNSSKQCTQLLQDFAKSKAIPPGENHAAFFPPVWKWSQQFSTRDQTLFNNPMYVGKGAACVQNGEVKTFQRTKKAFSSTVRISSTSQRNGVKGEEETLQRRASLGLKAEFSPVKDESPSERFFRDWFSRPADQQGVLIPYVLPSHVVLWKLFFLRWVPEACIPHGGPATVYHKVSLLVDEIETLQNKLRQYKGPSPHSTPKRPSAMTLEGELADRVSQVISELVAVRAGWLAGFSSCAVQ